MIGDVASGGRQRGGQLVGDLGFQLAPSYQGQGYAREAVHALLRSAFTDLALDVVTASCDEANIPSWELLERMSMQLQDRSEEQRRYAITKEQWRRSADRPGSSGER